MDVIFFRNTGHKTWIKLIKKISEGLKDVNFSMLNLGDTLFVNHTEKDLIVHKTDKHPSEVAHAITVREIMGFLDREGIST